MGGGNKKGSNNVMLNGVKVVSEDEYWRGYSMPDDDYRCWTNRSVRYEKDNRVIVTGMFTEIGADRPGMSYLGMKNIQVGTFDPVSKVFTH